MVKAAARGSPPNTNEAYSGLSGAVFSFAAASASFSQASAISRSPLNLWRARTPWKPRSSTRSNIAHGASTRLPISLDHLVGATLVLSRMSFELIANNGNRLDFNKEVGIGEVFGSNQHAGWELALKELTMN